MENDLFIRLDRGSMTIHLDEFFPAPADKLRKLLNIIRRDARNYDDPLYEKMIAHIEDQIAKAPDRKWKLGRDYKDISRELAVEKENHRSTARGSEEFQNEKDYIESLEKDMREAWRLFNRCDRDLEMYKKNLALIKERIT